MKKTKQTKAKKVAKVNTMTRLPCKQVSLIDSKAKLYSMNRSEAIRSMLDFIERKNLIDKALLANENPIRKSKMNTTEVSQIDIPHLFYGDASLYYPDQELMLFSRQFQTLDALHSEIDQRFGAQQAESVKRFIRHMNGVIFHIDQIFNQIDTEMDRNEDSIYREYLLECDLIQREEMFEVEDAIRLLKNRDLLDLERMCLFTINTD
jgi:hypothetical protein